MYIILILSYVDPIQIIHQKEIRIESRKTQFRIGTIKEYLPNANEFNIDECLVLYDDDAEMKIEPEDNIRFVGTSRGFVTLLLHGIYKKVRIEFLECNTLNF